MLDPAMACVRVYFDDSKGQVLTSRTSIQSLVLTRCLLAGCLSVCINVSLFCVSLCQSRDKSSEIYSLHDMNDWQYTLPMLPDSYCYSHYHSYYDSYH